MTCAYHNRVKKITLYYSPLWVQCWFLLQKQTIVTVYSITAKLCSGT